jgi:hypothetical protein
MIMRVERAFLFNIGARHTPSLTQPAFTFKGQVMLASVRSNDVVTIGVEVRRYDFAESCFSSVSGIHRRDLASRLRQQEQDIFIEFVFLCRSREVSACHTAQGKPANIELTRCAISHARVSSRGAAQRTQPEP